MSIKQESVSDATFKTWLFSSDFNFASKDDRVTTATYQYCPLVVSPTVTNCCKKLHLKYGKIENFAMHENYSGFVWKPVFFLIILKCCFLYRKSSCFTVLLFTVWWSIFDQASRRLLPLSCFYRSIFSIFINQIWLCIFLIIFVVAVFYSDIY